MSLSELVDNILLIARNNNITESEHLSKIQIEKWIVSYRALLIKQDIEKDKDIKDSYVSTIGPIHLDKQEDVPGYSTFVGDQTLPKLVDLANRPAVLAVHDMFGNLIQVGTETKAKLQRYRQATCKDYIAYVKGDKLYVGGDGTNNQLEWVTADVIAQDPSELGDCYNPDDEYPIPIDKIPTITNMILQNELRTMIMMPSDESNDTHDDVQNAVKLSKK